MKKDDTLKIIVVIAYVVTLLIQQNQLYDVTDCYDLFLIPRFIYEISLKEVIVILIGWLIEKLIVWIYCYKYLERFIDDNGIYILVRSRSNSYLYFYIQRMLLSKISIFVIIKIIICMSRSVSMSLGAILLFMLLIFIFENVALFLYLVSNDRRALAISIIIFLALIVGIHQVIYSYSLQDYMYSLTTLIVICLLYVIISIIDIVALRRKEY